MLIDAWRYVKADNELKLRSDMGKEWQLYHHIHDVLLKQLRNKELSEAVRSLISIYQERIANLEVENAALWEELDELKNKSR